MNTNSIAIIGCGNIGCAIAKGLAKSGISPSNIIVTRRKVKHLLELKKSGFNVTNDNLYAVKNAQTIILAVPPNQIMILLDQISSYINNNQLIISLVSGVEVKQIQLMIDKDIAIIRAMPNTAAVICESMTCLSSLAKFEKGLNTGRKLFNRIGKTLVIDEEQMASATALCACGVAFFLRAIRSASQGGIEIGFHSEESLIIAAQTARGAAALLLDNQKHPEAEIDRVTTPMGATIAGLNEMEHQGFSSAMIKGITTSTNKVNGLFKNK